MILRASARSRLRSRGEYAGIDSDEQKSVEHEGLTAWASTPYVRCRCRAGKRLRITAVDLSRR